MFEGEFWRNSPGEYRSYRFDEDVGARGDGGGERQEPWDHK